VGRVEPQTPQYNNMRKNFSAIVATDVTVVYGLTQLTR